MRPFKNLLSVLQTVKFIFSEKQSMMGVAAYKTIYKRTVLWIQSALLINSVKVFLTKLRRDKALIVTTGNRTLDRQSIALGENWFLKTSPNGSKNCFYKNHKEFKVNLYNILKRTSQMSCEITTETSQDNWDGPDTWIITFLSIH